MEIDKMKAGRLSCLVFISMIFTGCTSLTSDSNKTQEISLSEVPVYSDWDVYCKKDVITDEITSGIQSKEIMAEEHEIKSAIYYRDFGDSINIFLSFDYLSINRESNSNFINESEVVLLQVYKLNNVATVEADYEVYYISPTSSNTLFAKNEETTLEQLIANDQFIIRIPYSTLGDVTFIYPIAGLKEAIVKLKECT